jgi:hypothetical protein
MPNVSASGATGPNVRWIGFPGCPRPARGYLRALRRPRHETWGIEQDAPFAAVVSLNITSRRDIDFDAKQVRF